MKKRFFPFLLWSLPFFSPAQSPITLEFLSPVQPVQDIFGLTLIEVELKNHTDSTINIRDFHFLFFKAKVDMEDKWIKFTSGNASFSNAYFIGFKGYSQNRIITSLNIFDLFKEYESQMGKQLPFDKPHNLTICACITSDIAPRKFCSDEVVVTTNAMSATDRAAFAYIAKNDYDPYRFTDTSCMEGPFSVKSDIADSLSLHYPTSTFKMLADLSIAHEKAGLKEVPEALKPEIRQLLEKPLASPYTYVRYLAETLRKRLQ